MAYYRSDWPEVGLETAINSEMPSELGLEPKKTDCWVRRREVSGGLVCVVLQRNQFESDFYRFPMVDLYIECSGPEAHFPDISHENHFLHEVIEREIHGLLASRDSRYVAARVVRGEPLYGALRRLDFHEVERRRLYICKIADLTVSKPNHLLKRYEFKTLSSARSDRASDYREQILDICCQSFSARGFTRHYTDPYLVKHRPSIDYMLAVMEQNFKSVPEGNLLIAVDKNLARVCGFSVVGTKPGLSANLYTQLLSAVMEGHRGVGIYRGLTWVLRSNFPPEAKLLNVTHVENTGIQRAYESSGRRHLSDTVIVRRVFE